LHISLKIGLPEFLFAKVLTGQICEPIFLSAGYGRPNDPIAMAYSKLLHRVVGEASVGDERERLPCAKAHQVSIEAG
jgi:hypothetical protein